MEKTSKQFPYKSIQKWISESTFLLLLLMVFLFFEAKREHNSVPFRLLWRNIINPIHIEKFIGYFYKIHNTLKSFSNINIVSENYSSKFFIHILLDFPRHLVIYNSEVQWQETRFNILVEEAIVFSKLLFLKSLSEL
jgi:hypothetical protein